MSLLRSRFSSQCALGLFVGLGLLAGPPGDARAAAVASDGGLTLWVSWDNLDSPGTDIDDVITETNLLPGGFSCTATNTGRSAVGAGNSPASCPASGSCTGRQKVTGDLTKLADYIWQASEGTHYLRRVYVTDEGRAWDSADITWNMGIGGSSASGGGWSNTSKQMKLQSAYRTCIHDVLHHELGHYFYNLPDRYEIESEGYYKGRIGGGNIFNVDVTTRDINTVMSNNYPHLFVDTLNASITVEYTPPSGTAVAGEVLTPSLLTDGDAANDGPDRDHHDHTNPFAQDEWSLLPTRHVDMTDVHVEGTFEDPGATPALDIVFIDGDAASPPPGTILVLDRSGSMSVATGGVQAVQYVQEAGMFLYHSSEATDRVGTILYNAAVDTLFDYAIYDPTNDLPFTSFKSATGATNIALALEIAIDKLIATHGVGGTAGSEIYLLSDGVQTTGSDLFDEVERANGQGIKIHTLSFGNADSDTMDAIAGGSGGSNTLMSERDDAAELKMVMANKFETGRGRTELLVLKGVIPEAPRVHDAGREIFEADFSVPPRSQDLQFYVFSPTGDPSQDLSLQLQSPSGAVFDSLPPDNVAKLGRFNAVRVAGPELGVWKYRLISTGANLPSDEVEVAIYAQNRELDTAVFVEGPDLGKVLIRSQLHFRYPLTKLAVRADIYHRGQLVAQIPLADDGAPGIDGYGEDGVYAGLLDLSASGDARLDFALDNGAKKLRVKVESIVVAGTAIPAPFAHYETGITQSEIDADYAAGNKSSFSAWGEAMIQTSEPEGPGPMLGTSLPSTVATVISRGQDSSFDLVIYGARPLADQLRVSLGQGIAVTVAPLPSPPTGNLQTRIRVHLSVAPNATIGSRNLAVQFGNEILTLTAALEIQAANDVPALKNASKLLLMLTLAMVAVALARRPSSSAVG